MVGIDEAGRGPLSGPVVAAAVVVKTTGSFASPAQLSKKVGRASLRMTTLKDSKKLSPKKREEVYKFLKQHPDIEWGIGRVGHKVIDRINILEATKLAMKRAVKSLEKRLMFKTHDRELFKKIDFLLIDGNFGINLPILQKSIIKGDENVFLIKLASIIAKVTRDRAMLRYHKRYPQYGFDRHKGYPTKYHRAMLKKYGPCRIHRKSFRPLKS